MFRRVSIGRVITAHICLMRKVVPKARQKLVARENVLLFFFFALGGFFFFSLSLSVEILRALVSCAHDLNIMHESKLQPVRFSRSWYAVIEKSGKVDSNWHTTCWPDRITRL